MNAKELTVLFKQGLGAAVLREEGICFKEGTEWGMKEGYGVGVAGEGTILIF